MKLNPHISLTLFEPGVPETSIAQYQPPYSVAMHLLEQSEEDPRYPEDEIPIFASILEHEVALYERRGYIAGPLAVQMGETAPLDLASQDSPFLLPSWVEDDGLQLISCEAKGILLIETDYVFEALFALKSWQSTGLVLATGSGMPRAAMRRFLHRIQHHFELPIYVLSDNDTWGYFLYSMLHRGALAPHAQSPYLAIRDLRYLGLQAQRIDPPMENKSLERPWKEHWKLRLECMRQYDCFRTDAWQAELNAFEERKCARNLNAVLEQLGPEYILEIVNSTISNRKWIGAVV
jgi:DNA topoisomerase-6 subunit A